MTGRLRLRYSNYVSVCLRFSVWWRGYGSWTDPAEAEKEIETLDGRYHRFRIFLILTYGPGQPVLQVRCSSNKLQCSSASRVFLDVSVHCVHRTPYTDLRSNASFLYGHASVLKGLV